MRTYAADTDAGLKRDHNEDCYAAVPELGLWLVADGIGGHDCGEVASDIVRSTVCAAVEDGSSLETAIKLAHEAVLREIDGRSESINMGSTLVALKLDGADYEIAWVGDSRAYLWDDELTPLTRDHSYVASLVEEGLITAEQALHHPERHIITQSLGVSANMELRADFVSGSLLPRQQILLCSDGLTDELSDAGISVEMRRHLSPAGQVRGLLESALRAGGRDNVTVVVLGRDSGAQGHPVSNMETTQDVVVDDPGEQSATGSGRWLWLAAALVLGLVLFTWLS